MATVMAAKAIGILDYGIAVGNQADLVILAAASATEAIAAAPVNRTVIKAGKVVARSRMERQIGTEITLESYCRP